MSHSLKTFKGMVCEGSIKDIPKDNCYRMKNMRCLENKFLTRSGYKKYNSVQYDAHINLIYEFHRVVGGNLKIIGYGTNLYEGIPFEGYTGIHNCVELQAMQDDLAGKYFLANDIDCTYCTQDPNGALYNGGLGFDPVGTLANKFAGIFDGNGYTITGLFIDRPSTDYVGLFGYTDDAEIKNVGMIDIDMNGAGFVGGLIGKTDSSTVIKCYSTGAVSGQRAGGLIGGIVVNSTVTNCYSECAASGSVSADLVGGFIGQVNSSTVIKCYSTGAVSAGGAASVGGLIGYNSGGTYNDDFWDTETSGQATSAGGTGKTTAQMKQEATFTNWNFTTIWAIVEDVSYPTLR